MLFITRISRLKPHLTRHHSTAVKFTTASPTDHRIRRGPKVKKPRYRPTSSLEYYPYRRQSPLPFDFRFSYTESNLNPIAVRQPSYSPFGPGRLLREWTGIVARVKPTRPDDDNAKPVKPVKAVVEEEEDKKMVKRRREIRGEIQGAPLSEAEKKLLVDICVKGGTKGQVNLGRHGLTHNTLDVIHCHWKLHEVVKIKCMGVSTIDMENICTQLEDKLFGRILHRHGGLLVLYRGRNYRPCGRIPLMLWKPRPPVYPELIKARIGGLSIEETKVLRKRGLAVPALTKLARNGYYGDLVSMVREAFLVADLLRIDCTGIDMNDIKKIGLKLRVLVPCIPVTIQQEQIVIWRGKKYQPREDGSFLEE